jgi:alkanesulfonate monooxygenase SsuD/methylene tetrahydromethanopterin reductase-like flavin-dependent oxidoreductase (luciferase family)
MRFGFVVPYAAEAREFADLAALGERAGWDAAFSWEALWGVEAWIALGAAAMQTETIRLGTLLTPVPRWKPWDLATKVRTVDVLSGGRAILCAGLGALHDGWLAFEADEGRKVRAEKLDEGLAIYAGLMAGQPFEYAGRHFSARPTDFMLPAPPVQQPRPPVWVVGAHMVGRDRQPSLARAARWDGLLPVVVKPGEDQDKPRRLEDFVEVVARTRRLREDAGLDWTGYDVVLEADSSGEFVTLLPDEPAAWAAAGATWWVESWWSLSSDEAGLAELRRRIEAGPRR